MSLLTNLQAYYKMDEGTGTSVADSTANANNGTFANSPTWETGIINNGVGFSGTKRVDIPNSTSLNITGNKISISLWLYQNSSNNNNGVLFKGSLTNTQGVYSVVMGNGAVSDLKFRLNGGTAPGSGQVSTTGAISVGAWNHIVCVYDGATQKIYLNSVLNNTSTFTANLTSNTNPLYLGQYFTSSGFGFNGKLDEIAIWNRDLSASEVTTLYNSGLGSQRPFIPPVTRAIKALVVAGGGGGCGNGINVAGGGGGAGGFLYNVAEIPITPGPNTVTVGIGGIGGSLNISGTVGTNSVFSTLTAIGGSAGIIWGNSPVGGSGAGASGSSGAGGGGIAGLGTSGQGNNGGIGVGAIGGGNASSGGGGGAGGAGGNAPSTTIGGSAGIGLANSISGASVVYCKGGLGYGFNQALTSSGVNPGDGGGGRGGGGGGSAGSGSNGIVILSYATNGSDGISNTSTGGTITTSGSQTIHTFTTSGTFTMVTHVPTANTNFFMYF